MIRSRLEACATSSCHGASGRAHADTLPGYAIYGLTFGFVYVSSRFVEGLPRYFSVVFPLYVALALLVRRWPRLGTPLLAGSVAAQTLCLTLFANGYWFT